MRLLLLVEAAGAGGVRHVVRNKERGAPRRTGVEAADGRDGGDAGIGIFDEGRGERTIGIIARRADVEVGHRGQGVGAGGIAEAYGVGDEAGGVEVGVGIIMRHVVVDDQFSVVNRRRRCGLGDLPVVAADGDSCDCDEEFLHVFLPPLFVFVPADVFQTTRFGSAINIITYLQENASDTLRLWKSARKTHIFFI